MLILQTNLEIEASSETKSAIGKLQKKKNIIKMIIMMIMIEIKKFLKIYIYIYTNMRKKERKNLSSSS